MLTQTVNNWTIESRSPNLTNLTTPPPTSNGRARIAFTADFTDDAPIALKVTPGPAATADAVTFIFDPTLINHTGSSWFSADFDLVDDVTTPAPGPTHPLYAHFHDGSMPVAFPNWENPTLGPFVSYYGQNVTTGTPQSVHGANQYHLSAGATGEFQNNTSAALTGFGVHEFRTVAGQTSAGNGGEFYIVLAPGGDSHNFDQVIEGGDGADVLTGDASHFGSPLPRNDLIYGYDGNDTLSGQEGNDTLVGGAGDDTLDGGNGTNLLLGGAGTDTAVFNLPRSAFTVQTSLFHQFNIILPGSGGATIFDSVDGVEFFKFSDVTLSAADVVSGVPSASPDGTIVTTAGPVIRTANGDTWSIMDGRVAVNGAADMTTARVVALVYKNGQVWQENADKLWWAKTTPADQWSPPLGTATPPVAGVTLAVSADNTVLTNDWQTIVDANQHTWSIVNGQVSVDGQIDNTTANVVALAYEKGQIWQENTDNLWWAKTTPADQWSPDFGTSVSPVTGTGIMPLVDPLAADNVAVSSDSVGMPDMGFMQPGTAMSSTPAMMPASPMSGVSMTPTDLPSTGSPSMDATGSASMPMGFMPQDSQTMDMMMPAHS